MYFSGNGAFQDWIYFKKVTYITCILSKLTEMVMNEEQRETLTSKVSVEIAAMSNNLSNTQTQNISIWTSHQIFNAAIIIFLYILTAYHKYNFSNLTGEVCNAHIT